MSHDPFRGPPGTNPPRHQERSSNFPAVILVIALVLVGVAAYAMLHHRSTASSPPAVTTSAPGPATGIDTTGQAHPRAK